MSNDFYIKTNNSLISNSVRIQLDEKDLKISNSNVELFKKFISERNNYFVKCHNDIIAKVLELYLKIINTNDIDNEENNIKEFINTMEMKRFQVFNKFSDYLKQNYNDEFKKNITENTFDRVQEKEEKALLNVVNDLCNIDIVDMYREFIIIKKLFQKKIHIINRQIEEKYNTIENEIYDNYSEILGIKILENKNTNRYIKNLYATMENHKRELFNNYINKYIKNLYSTMENYKMKLFDNLLLNGIEKYNINIKNIEINELDEYIKNMEKKININFNAIVNHMKKENIIKNLYAKSIKEELLKNINEIHTKIEKEYSDNYITQIQYCFVEKLKLHENISNYRSEEIEVLIRTHSTKVRNFYYKIEGDNKKLLNNFLSNNINEYTIDLQNIEINELDKYIKNMEKKINIDFNILVNYMKNQDIEQLYEEYKTPKDIIKFFHSKKEELKKNLYNKKKEILRDLYKNMGNTSIKPKEFMKYFNSENNSKIFNNLKLSNYYKKIIKNNSLDKNINSDLVDEKMNNYLLYENIKNNLLNEFKVSIVNYLQKQLVELEKIMRNDSLNENMKNDSLNKLKQSIIDDLQKQLVELEKIMKNDLLYENMKNDSLNKLKQSIVNYLEEQLVELEKIMKNDLLNTNMNSDSSNKLKHSIVNYLQKQLGELEKIMKNDLTNKLKQSIVDDLQKQLVELEKIMRDQLESQFKQLKVNNNLIKQNKNNK